MWNPAEKCAAMHFAAILEKNYASVLQILSIIRKLMGKIDALLTVDMKYHLLHFKQFGSVVRTFSFDVLDICVFCVVAVNYET